MKLYWFDVLYYDIFAICVIAIVGLIVWIIYELYIASRNEFLRYEEFHELVEVIRKNYQKEETNYIPMTISTGETTTTIMTPIFHDEEFNVYLVYKGNEYCFNDEDMFNSLKVGDKVNVVVHEGYNQKGDLKNTYLTIAK